MDCFGLALELLAKDVGLGDGGDGEGAVCHVHAADSDAACRELLCEWKGAARPRHVFGDFLCRLGARMKARPPRAQLCGCLALSPMGACQALISSAASHEAEGSGGSPPRHSTATP